MKKLRGYIFSRPFMGNRVPQHVQNIVIKNYCEARNVQFLLSATEHVMPGCQMILEQVLSEIIHIDGAILYSIFQLPENERKRTQLYARMLKSKKIFHFAVERLQASTKEDFSKIEQLWQLQKIVTSPQNFIDLNLLYAGQREVKC